MNNNEAIITRPFSQKNMDFAHGEAIAIDEARRAEVVQTMPSGLVITRGMLEDEVRTTKAPRVPSVPTGLIIGVNASSNMFA